MTKLTDTAIRAKLAPGRYGDGGGLYLLVGPTGAKSWVFRFKVDGRERSMGLGPYPAMSLAKARQEAQRCRQWRAEGKDPITAREAERARLRQEAARAVTFEQAAKQFIASRENGWKNDKHRQQWPNTMAAYVYPIIGSLPVAAIDNRYVLDVLEQTVPAAMAADGRELRPGGRLWDARSDTAARVRGRIEAVLDWARFNGYRQGDNPARWRGNLDFALKKARRASHHAALPFGEIAAFVKEIRARDGVAALALEFLILTAARTGEVLGAQWEEIDEGGAVWTVPAHRMKAGREHRVPLSPAALAVVARAKPLCRGEYVFPAASAKRPLSNMALLALLRRMGRDDVTAHGFRSSFRDWTAERTSFPGEVAEIALSHAVADRVEAAYRRGDLFEKRRKLMTAWADYCDGKSGAEVLQLDGRAA